MGKRQKFPTNNFDLLRLLAALWVCIGLTAAVALGLGHDLLNPMGFVWFFFQLGGAIYTPAELATFGFGSHNGALWTIPLELQFYVVLPIFFYWLFRSSRSLTGRLIGVAVLSCLIAFACQHFIAGAAAGGVESVAAKLLRYSFLPHFYLFMTGVCLQRMRAEVSSVIPTARTPAATTISPGTRQSPQV